MKKLFAPLALALAFTAAPAPGRAEIIFGVTPGNVLFSFDSASPGTILSSVAIGGLVGPPDQEQIVGIDFRPANGQLVGVGLVTTPVGGLGFVRTIDPATGATTPINTVAPNPPLFPGLAGTAFGVDFNPVPDALRIVSNTGQNLRVNVNGANAGLVRVDTAINVVSANPSGVAPSVVASAYTNNDRDAATGTRVYAIDARGDALYEQTNANAGTLSYVADLKMLDMATGQGALMGVNTTSVSAFDVSASGIAYASLTDEFTGDNWLFSVNLSGQQPSLTYLGLFGQAGVSLGSAVIGLTATTAAPVPEPTSMALSLAALGLIGFGLRRRMA